MKNLYHFLSFLALTATLTLLNKGTAEAQTAFIDGEIVYSVEMSSPNHSQNTDKLAEGGKLIYNFKNRLFRSHLELGETEFNIIRDGVNQTTTRVIDRGVGSKYLVHLDAEDRQDEADKYKGLTFKNTSKTEEIAGLKAQEAIGKLPDGETFQVYYSPDFQPTNQQYNPRFTNLPGIPLKFDVHAEHGIVLTFTAISVNQKLQPLSTFKTPTEGYRELTYKQLKELRDR